MAFWSSQIREKFWQFGQGNFIISAVWKRLILLINRASKANQSFEWLYNGNNTVKSASSFMGLVESHVAARSRWTTMCASVCEESVVSVCVCACVFASLSDKPKQVTRRALVQGVCWPPRRVDKDFCKTNTRVTRRSCQYNAALWPTARQLLRHLLQYNT